MNTLIIIANWILPLLYLILLIDYGVTFFMRKKTEHHLFWLIGVILFHLGFMIILALKLSRPPLIGVFENLSFLALSTTMVYAVVEWKTRDRRSGIFIFLLVFLFQYTSSIFLADSVATQSNWARLHVIPSVLAYTALSISAVYGLLHILAGRNLKQHHIGLLFDRLPPVELLGKMTWYALFAGFLFITISMITGSVISRGADPTVFTSKVLSKIILGSAVWLLCLAAVLGRLLGKWSSSRISKLSLTVFSVMAIMLIVSAVLS